MKLAIVVGGWHWPALFFQQIAAQANGADLFVVAHRNPELRIVREEKADILENAIGILGELDRKLYAVYPTISELTNLGWRYVEEPNTIGDWGFFNQWLDRNNYRNYDVILNCHDDTFIRREGLFDQLAGDWLILGNGKYYGAPDGWVRGSFEFWKREMLDIMGGRFNLGDVTLKRVGKTDSPNGMKALSPWNASGLETRRFIVKYGITRKMAWLSPYYRISKWVIEGERGFMHFQNGASQSFADGLMEFPL